MMNLKKDDNKLNTRQIWLWIGVPVISIIINAVISDIQEKNGIISLIVSMVFLGLLILIIYCFYNRCIFLTVNNALQQQLYQELSSFAIEINERISNKNHILDTSKSQIGIIPEHELAEIERNGEYDEIWVISHDLSAELDSYVDIVPYNLQRGIKYKFFYQNTLQNDIRVEKLKKKNNHSKNAEYYKLKDEFFFIVANLDFTIYNPFSLVDNGRVGYIGLELPNSSELYALKVNDDLVDSISSTLFNNYLIDGDKYDT